MPHSTSWKPVRLTCSRPAPARCFPSAILRVESFEERIVPSWGSTPPATLAIPASTAVILTDASASGSAAISTSENDFYTFTATKTGSYRLMATGSGTAPLRDSVLSLYNAAGQRVAYNDDISSSNRNSAVSANLIAGQRYSLGITSFSGSAAGTYAWSVVGPAGSSVPATPPDANATFATATDLGAIWAVKQVTGQRIAASDNFFRFTLPEGGRAGSYVAINFTTSLGDLDLKLYDAGGRQINISQGTGNSEVVSLAGLAGGTYVFQVYGYSGARNPSYSITIDPVPIPARVPTPTPTPTPAPPPAPAPAASQFPITLRTTGLTGSQISIANQAAARWQQVIQGALPSATYQGATTTGVIVDVSAPVIDGVGGVLGQAGPDAFRPGTYLAYHGAISLDAADMARLEQNGTLLSVLTHEMGHILGIGTLWSARGLIVGAGTADPRYIGANAVREYNAIYGVNATSVPVEGNNSGVGSRDSHWRESVFTNELMTPYLTGTTQPLSRVTIGALADLGYQVNYSAASAFVPTSAAAIVSASLTIDGAGLVADPGSCGSYACPFCGASFVRTATQQTTPPEVTTPVTAAPVAMVSAQRAFWNGITSPTGVWTTEEIRRTPTTSATVESSVGSPVTAVANPTIAAPTGIRRIASESGESIFRFA